MPRARRRRALSPWAAVIGVLLLLAFAAARVLPDMTGIDSPPDALVVDPVPGATAARVVRVIDGDTLDVHDGSTEFRVRLFGINAPERGEDCHLEAGERLTALAGDVVQLLPDERREDRFGRQLRYVYSSDAALIDELLILEGLALAWREDGRLRDHLAAAEDQARSTRVSCLWGAQ